MGTLAAILGGVAALCAIFGIILAIDVFTIDLNANLGWTFWLILSAVLFLASITASVGNKGNTEE
jgi:hypothetical protein